MWPSRLLNARLCKCQKRAGALPLHGRLPRRPVLNSSLSPINLLEIIKLRPLPWGLSFGLPNWNGTPVLRQERCEADH